MARKTGSGHAKSRRFGSPPEAHKSGFVRAVGRTREALTLARDDIQLGDCENALRDLLDARGFASVAGTEAKHLSGGGAESARALAAAKRLREEVAEVAGDFRVSCARGVDPGRKVAAPEKKSNLLTRLLRRGK